MKAFGNHLSVMCIMNIYKADIHIHTVLSPCGDLEMSPVNIVASAKRNHLDIIGITDHNSTRHCRIIRKLAESEGIFVLSGAEVTTREEVHCLVFFENDELLDQFQDYLNAHLPFVKNNPLIFGYQVVVDEHENILEEIDTLLIVGINQSIGQLRNKVRELNGIFIPAHVDRQRFGIIGQLGFIPDDLDPDAIEILDSHDSFRKIYPDLHPYRKIKNSDAHYPDQIGSSYSLFKMEQVSFTEIANALRGEKGREVLVA